MEALIKKDTKKDLVKLTCLLHALNSALVNWEKDVEVGLFFDYLDNLDSYYNQRPALALKLNLKPQASISRTRHFRGRANQLKILTKNLPIISQNSIDFQNDPVPDIPSIQDVLKYNQLYSNLYKIMDNMERNEFTLADGLKVYISLKIIMYYCRDSKLPAKLSRALWEEIDERFYGFVNSPIVRSYTFLARIDVVDIMKLGNLDFEGDFLEHYNSRNYEQEMCSLLSDFAEGFMTLINHENMEASKMSAPASKKSKAPSEDLFSQILDFTPDKQDSSQDSDVSDSNDLIDLELEKFKKLNPINLA